MLRVVIPFSQEKNLGKAYNQEIALAPDNSWICLLDQDVLLLTPDTINHLHRYVELFPDTGIFTCWTNRLHPLGHRFQMTYRGEDGYQLFDNDKIRDHISVAREYQQRLYEVTELQKHISGFLMLINKQTWNEIKFNESRLCLGVDNDFSDRVLKSGRKIRRMEGIYVWHTYRLEKGIKDKSHLL